MSYYISIDSCLASLSLCPCVCVCVCVCTDRHNSDILVDSVVVSYVQTVLIRRNNRKFKTVLEIFTIRHIKFKFKNNFTW